MDGKGNTDGSGRLTLLADAGGTKTSWVLTGGDEVLKYKASGINLAVMTKGAVLSAVLEAADMMGAENVAAVGKIRYYGAGVIDSRNILILDSVLKNVFPGAEAVYGSDLLAAAEAGIGDSHGIICILGTGSNSGVYDGVSETEAHPDLPCGEGMRGLRAYCRKGYGSSEKRIGIRQRHMHG